MGQEEVEKVLKKNKGKWLDSKEIADILRKERHQVAQPLNKLRRQENIEYKRVKEGNYYKFKYKFVPIK
ncbi:MAG TPA: hypothetical protein VJ912_01690 [Candidatus Nanoarchaeia archaeon]|nr:hypothetical protein [Candidatus Nanoarchaeia archaeon]